MATPFNIIKGSEASIKACNPLKGCLWFALDTRKIYYSDGEDFISMGGNSSVFYGTLTWSEDNLPDSDQVEFDFTMADIEGNATPNENDLILNTDGCFYRVTAVNGAGASAIIKTLKLTIAGSGIGGGGGGGGTPVATSIITIAVPTATKYFLNTESNPTFSFDVHSTKESGNQISRITYTIGSRTYVDDEPHNFGTITLDLKEYFNSISENGTKLSFVVEDIYGARKTSSEYTLRKVRLLLNADSTNNTDILQATDKKLQYRAIPVGSDAIKNVVLTYKIFVEGSTFPIETFEKNVNNLNGSVISQEINFEEVDLIGNGLGAYRLEVICSGQAGGQTIESNVLTHSVISYGENPILIAYLPSSDLEQYESVDISYEIAKSVLDNQKARITFEVDNEISVQEVEFNRIYKVSLYFEEAGYHTVIVRDTYGHTQSFTNIYVSEYDGSIQIIDNTDIDLKLNLSARGRNNNEVASSRAVWADKGRTGVASLSNFIWGDVNGWLTDADGVDTLHISSGANLVVNGYEPFKGNGMVTGKTIELDFCVSEVTNYTAPLISCLSYTNDNQILCGFQITGEAATFNTQNIKATGSAIIDDDDHQEYNTQVQGLTTKFTEGERIHLTWVVQKNTEEHPMIKTYINGIVSGISEYTGGMNSDSIAQNETTGAEKALIKIGSETGTVDLYNIRVFDKVLSDRQVLENYIATLPTTEDKVSAYANNIGLLDSNGEISVNNIESGNYNITLPYIKFTGGGQCRKDDTGYWLTNADGTNHLPRAKKDFRLVNHFDFVYPTDPSRNVDLYSEVADNGLVNGVIMYGQGTSSMEYPVKNLRIKFKMKQNGKKVKFQVNPNDYPVDILTLKADYMESSSSHNTGTANLVFDSLEALGFHTPGQTYWNAQNPDYKTLTAIRGYPIICFFREDEDHDFEYIGRYNLNMDKSSEEAFGFLPVPEKESDIAADGSNIKFGWIRNDGINTNLDASEHPYVNGIHCYEFLNNASHLDNFITGDTGMSFHDLFYQDIVVDGETTKNWLTSFESRYPEDDMDVEAFYNMCAWVNSTCTTEATNKELDVPITYGGVQYTIDSAEYRLAKFKYEFEDHFNKNFVLFYYILTHVLLMIDSRAKNMMIATWGPEEGHGPHSIWYPIFYDMDTMLGLNNYGYNKFDYNVEDDEDLYPNVFNGQNSVLWLNVRACFLSDIRKLYNDMQTDGGLTYANLLRNYNDVQADMWNEIMYNYDANYKYIKPYAEGYYDGKSGAWVDAGGKNYLYAAQGSRSMHRRYWLANRIQYFNGKYLSSAYTEDRFLMRLYTPNAGGDNYVLANDVTAENFGSGTYYTRSGNTEAGFTFTPAASYQSGIEYYTKADSRLTTSLNVVPPSNDFTLTPLHNQYLAVAFGGQNGQTSGPHYAVANVPYLVEAPAGAKYNDTETYVYGASQLKDLGDLSSQYLGNMQFPGNTKLERLILGNKTNNYYNPNFSALSIGNSAPQLKYIDISNTQLKGSLDLSGCQNIEEVYACGSGITNISLPGYGVLKELRLPPTVTALVLSNQINLLNNHFTIGTYDSVSDTYTMSDNIALQSISIEGMPQFDSYALVKSSVNTLMYYCLRDISWTVDANEIVDTTDGLKGIKAIETIIANGVIPQKDGAETTPARALTGTVVFTGAIDASDTLQVYEHYSSIYPDLVFEFDESNVKHINLYDGDGNLYWSKPIATGSTLSNSFYDTSSYGEFAVPKKTSTQEFKYTFDNKWYIDNNSSNEILGDRPIVNGAIDKDYNFYPVFTSEIQTYVITYHINDDIVTKEVEFGTAWVDTLPTLIPFSEKNDALTMSNRKVYPFLGYSENSAEAINNIFNFNTNDKVATNKDFYAVFDVEQVDVTNSKNIFYPAWEITYRSDFNYDDTRSYNGLMEIANGNSALNLAGGYTIKFRSNWTYNHFATIPAETIDGQPIYLLERNRDLPSTVLNRVYCEKGSHLRMIGNSCFSGCSSLRYFEFPASLRQIGDYAFQNTSLENSVIGGENTTYIGELAFNQALRGNYLKIPGSVCILDSLACSYGSNMNDAWRLQIGDSAHYSELDLSLFRGESSARARCIFGQNEGHRAASAEFYSKRYSGWDEKVGSLTILEHLFGDYAPTIDNSWSINKEGQG